MAYRLRIGPKLCDLSRVRGSLLAWAQSFDIEKRPSTTVSADHSPSISFEGMTSYQIVSRPQSVRGSKRRVEEIGYADLNTIYLTDLHTPNALTRIFPGIIARLDILSIQEGDLNSLSNFHITKPSPVLLSRCRRNKVIRGM